MQQDWKHSDKVSVQNRFFELRMPRIIGDRYDALMTLCC